MYYKLAGRQKRGKMSTAIICVILVLIIVLAVFNSVKHFKGEGGCCGGGGSVKETKTLDAPKLGEKKILIEGMHCENCKNRVEHVVNQLDGAVCKVNLRKKTATVSYSREIAEEELKRVIEKAGYEVKSISQGKAV